METLSIPEVRQIALAAQGFADRAPSGQATAKHLRRVAGRTGLFQIDSVNVLQRAHYMPAYSHIGGYDTALLDRASARKPRWLFEYWGHEAALLPHELQPLMRWRMANAEKAWGGPRSIAAKRPDLVKWVLEEVRARGPVTAAQIEEDVPRAKDNWGWNWSEVNHTLHVNVPWDRLTFPGHGVPNEPAEPVIQWSCRGNERLQASVGRSLQCGHMFWPDLVAEDQM